MTPLKNYPINIWSTDKRLFIIFILMKSIFYKTIKLSHLKIWTSVQLHNSSNPNTYQHTYHEICQSAIQARIIPENPYRPNATKGKRMRSWFGVFPIMNAHEIFVNWSSRPEKPKNPPLNCSDRTHILRPYVKCKL